MEKINKLKLVLVFAAAASTIALARTLKERRVRSPWSAPVKKVWVSPLERHNDLVARLNKIMQSKRQIIVQIAQAKRKIWPWIKTRELDLDEKLKELNASEIKMRKEINELERRHPGLRSKHPIAPQEGRTPILIRERPQKPKT